MLRHLRKASVCHPLLLRHLRALVSPVELQVYVCNMFQNARPAATGATHLTEKLFCRKLFCLKFIVGHSLIAWGGKIIGGKIMTAHTWI